VTSSTKNRPRSDGTFESGALVVVHKIQHAVKTVLFAAIHGTL
jgi:hypothetical protein